MPYSLFFSLCFLFPFLSFLSLLTEEDVWPIEQYVLDGFLVSTPLVDRTENDGGQIEENRLSVACMWRVVCGVCDMIND